ncbi:MAG: SRPBCC family protein [Proteobacteria bacterium]|nr:SRPBCC family protein [Pseudomonadota bacterium]
MWTKTYSKTFINVRKKDIWRLWTNVNQWDQWHEDLDYCKMEGPFIVGNHFMLKPKGTSPVRIELTEVEEERKFTDRTKFFGAKMYDVHTVEETEEGVRLTNTLIVTGPLKFLWVKLVAQNVAKTVPQDMEALVTLARSNAVP